MKTLLSLALMTCSYLLQAQITLKPYDEPGKSGTKSIVFEYTPEGVTAAPGQPIKKAKKEFDIQENNPFRALANDQRLGQKLKAIKPEIMEGRSNDGMVLKKVSLIEGYQNVITFDQSAVVEYEERVYVEEQGDVAALEEYLIILNSLGDKIFEIRSVEGFSSVVVSKDNKLIAFNYGGYCIESDDCTYNDHGVRVLDIKSKKILDETSSQDVKNVGSPGVYKDYIFTTFRIEIGKYLLRLYDSAEGTKHEIYLDEYQRKHLVDYTDIGIIFTNRQGLKETIQFSNSRFSNSKY